MGLLQAWQNAEKTTANFSNGIAYSLSHWLSDCSTHVYSHNRGSCTTDYPSAFAVNYTTNREPYYNDHILTFQWGNFGRPRLRHWYGYMRFFKVATDKIKAVCLLYASFWRSVVKIGGSMSMAGFVLIYYSRKRNVQPSVAEELLGWKEEQMQNSREQAQNPMYSTAKPTTSGLPVQG